MISISVEVCGDDWVNQNTVTEQLQTINSHDSVILDLRAEGPSLHALGIVDTVQAYVSADRVYVTNWSNAVETVTFRRLNTHLLSHFFWMSDRYQDAVPTERNAECLFGYFVGRRTVPRCVMLKDIQEKYNKHFLLSLMNTVAEFTPSNLDPLESWCDSYEFYNWFNNQTTKCLDNYNVRDQYQGDHNTNASLLRWYPEFDIELVSETYCHGDTFFVTEKTVRPIVAGKSMLVYGPKNYLARLRDLGFQTWNTVWDETYDKLTGPDRWCAMQSIIDCLADQNQEKLYQQCLPILEHNKIHAKFLIEKYRPR
jgi:hypothetical protein